jgi:hypothetical protein
MSESSLRRGLVSSERATRREVLRRLGSAGVLATATAGLSELFGSSSARAATTQLPQLPATLVLNALPPDAPTGLAAAIESQCCITYTRDEGHCGSPCPSGYCCYHVVSTGCGLDEVTCIEVSCAEGNFTTGC